MKKIILILCSVMVPCMFAACGSEMKKEPTEAAQEVEQELESVEENNEISEGEEEIDSSTVDELGSGKIVFSEETLDAMREYEEAKDWTSYDTNEISNYMNYGVYRYSGSWIYGSLLNKAKTRLTFGKIKVDYSEKTYLSDHNDGWINYIYEVDGWLFYEAYDSEEQAAGIYKMRISGSDETKIVSLGDRQGYISNFFINDNQIYYTINDESVEGKIPGALYRNNLDGTNEEIVIDRAVYFPYVIGTRIYYQDDNDKCTLHRCDLNGENDEKIIDEPVYSYYYNGDRLYYKTYSDDSEYDFEGDRINPINVRTVIKSCKLNGTSIKDEIVSGDISSAALNEQYIFYVDNTDEGRLYSKNLLDGSTNVLSQKKNTTVLHVSDKYIYYMEQTTNANTIEGIYLCRVDGTDSESVLDW